MAQATSLRQDRIADVLIIGSGIHGCSTALHLARRGLSVIVIEKDYSGRHASGVNAGGVRRLGRALPEVPLSVVSSRMWHEIEGLVDDDCGFESSCHIKVAETEDEMTELAARASETRQLGYDHEKIIGRDDLRELLPNVSPHCQGAMVVMGDGHANPFRTVQAFRRKGEQLRVVFRQGVRVTSIGNKAGNWQLHTTQGRFEAPKLVNCAGAWGGRVAEMLGESVPLSPRAPMLMITQRMPPFVHPVVGTQGRPLSFKQFDNGTVLIGGGHQGEANIDTNATILNFKGLAISAETAVGIFPIMAKARIVRCWAGIEGVMPDLIPVIGPSTREGAFHAFGFSAHGFQLGPIGGQILSELIIDGKSSLPIEAFDIERFADAPSADSYSFNKLL